MNATTHPTSPALSRRAAARRRAAERRRPRLSRLLAWLLSAVLGSAGLAFAQVPAGALPSGGKVMVGSGQLQQAGSLLVVQQDTARLGLDWQSFNIGSGATVEFRQPGADSVALNRVLGHSGSQIFGQLRSNGQVFLTNPHGVLFAPGAKVDVGGLVASTLDLSQEDFAAGRYSFGGSSTASVVNQGSLRASAGGYLALFGPQVSNEGDITVDAGSVVLASGSAATVSISGGGLISAVVSPGAAGSVANSGSIVADGGVVRLSAQSAQDIAASLVNNSGVIRAHTLQERHGEIWITGDQAANSGSLSADSSSNADAGRVVLQGGMQAGSVDVGGTLSATSAGGRGGRVDTSAARVAVDADTRVDTRGGAGRHGHWTIDPTDFTVSAGSGSATASGIGASTLATNLGSTNVTLATAPAGSEAGDIHVNADVAWSAGTTLTLQAAHDININAHINASGDAAGLVLTPDGAQGGGSYKLGSNGKITLSGANPTLQVGAVNYTVIRTLDALQAIDISGLTGNFALGIDLDASSTATANGGLGFNPIGGATSSTSAAFRGRFEGLGHTINGLVINRPTDSLTGLFSQLHNASVSNLHLGGGSVVGSTYVGGLAGLVTGTSQVLNVHSAQDITASPASASTTVYAGGLLGAYQVNAGTASITRSSASGGVTSTSNLGYMGGLVGYQNAGGISDSSASGNLGLPGAATGYRLGGLVGQFDGSGSLLRVSATGAVPGNSDYAGGLVGDFNAAGSISNASASGAVSGRSYVGGLVGSASGNTLDVASVTASGPVTASGSIAGGLFGELGGSGSLSDAHATGNVTAGTNSVGGLAGTFSRSGTSSNLI
ncbi:MAG: filamentous hemagglutinin N-terminal domain-containing protein, partial [Rubrivivax sp.]|nr:filamentous hemagglutinin N-terminal domain-containing protein [Rubrivivax sp.]